MKITPAFVESVVADFQAHPIRPFVLFLTRDFMAPSRFKPDVYGSNGQLALRIFCRVFLGFIFREAWSEHYQFPTQKCFVHQLITWNWMFKKSNKQNSF